MKKNLPAIVLLSTFCLEASDWIEAMLKRKRGGRRSTHDRRENEDQMDLSDSPLGIIEIGDQEDL